MFIFVAGQVCGVYPEICLEKDQTTILDYFTDIKIPATFLENVARSY